MSIWPVFETKYVVYRRERACFSTSLHNLGEFLAEICIFLPYLRPVMPSSPAFPPPPYIQSGLQICAALPPLSAIMFRKHKIIETTYASTACRCCCEKDSCGLISVENGASNAREWCRAGRGALYLCRKKSTPFGHFSLLWVCAGGARALKVNSESRRINLADIV